MTRMIEHRGEKLSVRSWARRIGMSARGLRDRLDRRGWTVEQALTTPADPRRRKGGSRKPGTVRPVPLMKRHPSGRAYCRWKLNGSAHEKYFGKWGTPEADVRYRRFGAEWIAGPSVAEAGGKLDLTVTELFGQWIGWVATEYRKGGRLTSEFGICSAARDRVVPLYGDVPAEQFGPAALRVVRAGMVDAGLSRPTIARYVYRVCRCFSWGAGNSLIPAAIADALAHVEPLRAGRTTAPEATPRSVVSESRIEAVMPHLSPYPHRRALLASLIRFQHAVGCRPGEACALRPCDLDRTGDVWLYTVDAGKTMHQERPTLRWIGPRAQAVLVPLLEGMSETERVFPIGRDYYNQCVRGACIKAGIDPWTPHQLRHTHATMVAVATGSAQAAADSIGDSLAVALKHYVRVDPRERARIELAARFG